MTTGIPRERKALEWLEDAKRLGEAIERGRPNLENTPMMRRESLRNDAEGPESDRATAAC